MFKVSVVLLVMGLLLFCHTTSSLRKIEEGKEESEKKVIDFKSPPSAQEHWDGYVDNVYLTQLPQNFSCAVPYGHVAHNDQNGENSKVEVDYFKFFILKGGEKKLIYQDQYIDFNPKKDGGLFNLDPWCGGDEKEDMIVALSSNTMSFNPSDKKDKIYHWWSKERISIRESFTGILIEMRVRIQGGACVGVGLDWYKDEKCVPELNYNHFAAGVSKWYFSETSDWQTIQFTFSEK